MRSEILPNGHEAVGYSPNQNICFKGEVTGWYKVETARVRYAIYQITNSEGVEAEFPYYRVFTVEDLDNEEHTPHPAIQFKLDAKFYNIDPEEAIKMVISALSEDP